MRGPDPDLIGGAPSSLRWTRGTDTRNKTVGMIPLVAERTEELAALCRKHQVQRLDLFGSAAIGDFDPESSDLDFLVTFLPEANATYVGAYHRLYTDLNNLFDRPVDLVIETEFRNPYFRKAVEHTRCNIYQQKPPIDFRA